MRLYRQHEGLGLHAMKQYGIVPGKTAMIVVDMQLASTHRDFGFQKLLRKLGLDAELGYYLQRIEGTVVPNIQRLLTLFRKRSWPVIYLTIGSEYQDFRDFDLRRRHRIEFWKNRGLPIAYARVGERQHEINPLVAPEPGEIVINKTTASAFNSSTLQETLAERGVTTLVFVGVATNFCVEMTVRDAADRGYLCFVVEDACAATTRDMHEHAIETLGFYSRVVSTGQFEAELITTSGGAQKQQVQTTRE